MATKQLSSKPKCVSSTSYSCGYACINDKKICRAEVSKANADAILKAIKLRQISGKGSTALSDLADKATKAKTEGYTPLSRKLADSTETSLPKPPGWAVSEVFDSGDLTGFDSIVARLLKQGVQYETAEPLAVGLKTWLGGGYKRLSGLTYDSDLSKYTDGEAEVLDLAIRALKLMQPATLDAFVKSFDASQAKSYKPLPDSSRPSADSIAQMSRWITVKSESEFLSKYKEGTTIEENGMFGVTHLDEDQMQTFAKTANVKYVVRPKLDGSGRGKAVDAYKNKVYEGEVLFVPGTSFVVTKVVTVSEADKVPEMLSIDFREVGAKAQSNAMQNAKIRQQAALKHGMPEFEARDGSASWTLAEVEAHAKRLNEIVASGTDPSEAARAYFNETGGKYPAYPSYVIRRAGASFAIDFAELQNSSKPLRTPISTVYLEEA